MVHLQPWPIFDAGLAKEQEYVIPIQINGKIRGTVTVTTETLYDENFVFALIYNTETEKIQNNLKGKHIQNQRYIPGKIVSIVTD